MEIRDTIFLNLSKDALGPEFGLIRKQRFSFVSALHSSISTLVLVDHVFKASLTLCYNYK